MTCTSCIPPSNYSIVPEPGARGPGDCQVPGIWAKPTQALSDASMVGDAIKGHALVRQGHNVQPAGTSMIDDDDLHIKESMNTHFMPDKPAYLGTPSPIRS